MRQGATGSLLPMANQECCYLWREGAVLQEKKGHEKDAGSEMKGTKSEATPWDGNETEQCLQIECCSGVLWHIG